jgi:hypothetical protein
VLARLDTLVALQEAVPANQRVVATAATVMGARAIGNDATGFSRTVAAATQSLSLLLLAREMVERFSADRAAIKEIVTFNASIARLLGGLTEVRLVCRRPRCSGGRRESGHGPWRGGLGDARREGPLAG